LVRRGEPPEKRGDVNRSHVQKKKGDDRVDFKKRRVPDLRGKGDEWPRKKSGTGEKKGTFMLRGWEKKKGVERASQRKEEKGTLFVEKSVLKKSPGANSSGECRLREKEKKIRRGGRRGDAHRIPFYGEKRIKKKERDNEGNPVPSVKKGEGGRKRARQAGPCVERAHLKKKKGRCPLGGREGD